MFKVGDRVYHKKLGKGSIVEISTKPLPYLVEFDIPNWKLHDGGDAKYPDNHCWWCGEYDVTLIDKGKNTPQNKFYFKGNKTIYYDKDGKRYVTDLCKGDTYDRKTGMLVCLAKSQGIRFEELESYLAVGEATKTQVREVKRPAKVGEWVKIVKAAPLWLKITNHKIGDIVKIIKIDNLGYDDKTLIYIITESNDYPVCDGLFENEYVVLENYNRDNICVWVNDILVQ